MYLNANSQQKSPQPHAVLDATPSNPTHLWLNPMEPIYFEKLKYFSTHELVCIFVCELVSCSLLTRLPTSAI